MITACSKKLSEYLTWCDLANHLLLTLACFSSLGLCVCFHVLTFFCDDSQLLFITHTLYCMVYVCVLCMCMCTCACHECLPLFFRLLCFLSTPYQLFHMELLPSPMPILGCSLPQAYWPCYLLYALHFKVLQSLFVVSSSFPDYGPSRPEKHPLHSSPWASCCVLALPQAGTSLSWLWTSVVVDVDYVVATASC